ncbi:unnamed protein product [Thlaspi arvense]|uniref:RPW8 domain-containing protein n=1 Tax=Thlaspi arvense TaxID=13288 RepID=A0AAU9RIR6_THLAR|nr:unnamed protein product [Thlaspi arvense]
MAGVLVIGAGVGALASELLDGAIKEAKKVLGFKTLSRELASAMQEVVPIVIQIESSGDAEALKTLRVTIDKALVLVADCKGVKRWDAISKSIYTRRVEKINKEILKFCQIQLQLIQLRNQVQPCKLPEDITNCIQAISKRLDLMNVPAPVFRNLCSVLQLDEVPVGFDWPLTKLKKELLNDSVNTLLVSAAPGCGKTTLATQLCHDPDVKGKFKHIFFNVVSRPPNIKAIVQNLLQHNGYAPHIFDNDSQAAVGLQDLIKELIVDGDVLLVLDDVWQGAEFSLRRYFQQIRLPGCKILVTSRFNLPSFDFTYHLEPLEYEDAKSLLVQWSSPPNYHTSPHEYEELFQKILKRCNGYPIVIEVVGVSLKEQPLYAWKGQVESWSQGRTILDNPHPTVLDCLEPSFSALQPHLKECFLDMGSFLEDQKIRASVIIDIWLELYGKGSSTGNVYMKYLNDLASQNLLKLIPLGRNEHEDGFYNELLVTQHDLLRELAIHLSSKEKLKEKLESKRLNLEIQGDSFPDWCLNLREPINVRFLSISTDVSFTSKWVEMGLDCPNVEALVLNLSSSDYALPDFIATMKKLKVLIIINHGHGPAKLTNLSCLSSLPSLKRIRFEKVSITWLDILLHLQLGSLNKLSLVMCSFGKLASDTKEIDVSKSLSSLQEIDLDYCYDLVELPYWISEALSLKTLSITNCNKLSILPDATGNLSKLEVLRLCSCISLSELPETTERLSNLRFLDIYNCLGLRKLPLEIGKLQKLKKISMTKCSKCELPGSVKKLEDLKVICDEEAGFLWVRLKPKMKNLSVVVEETEHNLNLLQMHF